MEFLFLYIVLIFFFGRKEDISFNDSLKASDYTMCRTLPTTGVKYRINAKSNKYIS